MLLSTSDIQNLNNTKTLVNDYNSRLASMQASQLSSTHILNTFVPVIDDSVFEDSHSFASGGMIQLFRETRYNKIKPALGMFLVIMMHHILWQGEII